MAPRKPPPRKKKDDDYGGYGSKDAYYKAIQSGEVKTSEMGVGGVKSLIAKALIAATKSKAADPVLKGLKQIGQYAAGAGDDVGTFVAKTSRTVKTKGDVFTPQGVFKGKDVFIKKADLTPKQISGIQQGMETRAANQFAKESFIGAKGAAVGVGAGALGLYGAQKGVQTIKDNIENAKKIANKTKKVPKKK